MFFQLHLKRVDYRSNQQLRCFRLDSTQHFIYTVCKRYILKDKFVQIHFKTITTAAAKLLEASDSLLPYGL